MVAINCWPFHGNTKAMTFTSRGEAWTQVRRRVSVGDVEGLLYPLSFLGKIHCVCKITGRFHPARYGGHGHNVRGFGLHQESLSHLWWLKKGEEMQQIVMILYTQHSIDK